MRVIPHTKTNTETKIELIEHNHLWAKYCLTPTTGKQHQLRVHLNHLGIPIKMIRFIQWFNTKLIMIFLSPYSF